MAVYGYGCLCIPMYARIDLLVEITRDVSWGIHGLLTCLGLSFFRFCHKTGEVGTSRFIL